MFQCCGDACGRRPDANDGQDNQDEFTIITAAGHNVSASLELEEQALTLVTSPPQVSTPVSSAQMDWVNFVLKTGWDKMSKAANAFVTRILQEEVKLAIEDQKRKGMSINVDVQIDLEVGDSAPEFTSIKAFGREHSEVTRPDQQQGIEISALMKFQAKDTFKCQVTVVGSVAGLPVNVAMSVKYLEVEGVISGFLSPMLEDIPIFGGMQIYFVDMPRVKMTFAGMGGLGKVLGQLMTSTLRSVLSSQLQEYTIPGCKYIPLVKQTLEDRVHLISPKPFGTLVVTVYAARGLYGSDWNLFSKASADPEIEVALGTYKFRTRTQIGTLEPVWDPPEAGFLQVHNITQAVRLDIWDSDFGEHDDLLGVMQDETAVRFYQKTRTGKTWLPINVQRPEGISEEDLKKMQGGKQMEVQVSTEYLELAPLGAPLQSVPTDIQDPSKRAENGGPRGFPTDYVPLQRLVTVILFGVDCEESFADEVARCVGHVTLVPGQMPAGWPQVAVAKEPQSVMRKSIRRLVAGFHGEGASVATQQPLHCRTVKARPWGISNVVAARTPNFANITQQAQDMIDRMHRVKNLPLSEIAEIAGMSEDEVKMVVGMKRNLKVAWPQAFHFHLEFPAAKLELEVKTVKGVSLGKVELDLSEVEQAQGHRLAKKGELTEGFAASKNCLIDYEVQLRGFTRGELKQSVSPSGRADSMSPIHYNAGSARMSSRDFISVQRG